MILDTTADLKKYISISNSFVIEDFVPYINKAANSFTAKYVGDLHEQLSTLPTGTNADIKIIAREHLRNAIANFGYYMYLPFASVLMDSAGISVVNTDQRKNAEWWQIKDIRRECLRSGHEAMDLLLKFLEANPNVFTDYAANYSTINKELVVNSATVFSKYYNIFDSRQTYLALQSTLRLVEDQYLHTLLCPELITVLKSTASGNVLKLQVAIQKAMVAFTVAKVANTGLFLLDEKGLRVDFENMSDGRKESPSYGKSVEQSEKLAIEQINNGTQYLQLAKKIIEDNIADFNQCTSPLIQSQSSGTGYVSYDTKGVFGL
ncbi:MAG: DUF6712 family protein [Bacteroidota bacterium]